MRRLIRLSPLLLIVLLGLVIPSSFVLASTTVYWDFRIEDHGATAQAWSAPAEAGVNTYCGTSYTSFPLGTGSWSSGSGFINSSTTFNVSPDCEAAGIAIQMPNDDDLHNTTMTSFVVYISGSSFTSGFTRYYASSIAGDWGNPTDVQTCAFYAQDARCNGTGGNGLRIAWNAADAPLDDLRHMVIQMLSYGGNIEIDGIEYTYDVASSGTLTRPLTSGDEVDTSPVYDQTIIGTLATTNFQDYQFYPALYAGGLQTVSAWSDAPGAKVHAADSGSIVNVHPLAWDDCGIFFVSPSTLDTEDPDVTTFITSFQADHPEPCLLRRFEMSDDPHPDYGDIAKDEYWLDPTNAYLVTLQLGGGQKIQYLVKNAPNYVVVGDTVDAGCVLGETLGITTIPSTAINFPGIAGIIATAISTFAAPEFSFLASAVSSVTGLGGALTRSFPATTAAEGYTQLTLYDTDDSILELASQLTVEPTSDDNCNNTGDFKDCLAFNPQFARQGDGWVASGNVEWTEPGVILDPGESITATINLSSTGDYTATAYAQGENGAAGQLRIFLGSHTDRYTAPLEWSDLQLAAEPLGAPDAGTFYTVGVQNTGTGRIQVASLCVTDGAPNTGPNSCYFNNQSFVEGTSGWTVSEGVVPSDQALNVPDNGVISQNVMLNPLSGGPATYKLVVRGDWWYTGTLDTTSSASAIASVKYEYPDGTGYQDMVPINITGNLAFGAGQLAYIANIEVSSPTDDLMNIKVETTDAGDMGVVGIRITDACLSTVDGGPFPGQGGGGAPPPLDANCDYVSRPQTNDPAAWLQWHWEKSNQFFTCQLRVKLNQMYTLGQQSFRLAGWQARYAQSQLKLWTSWLGSQFFPWLNGQFRNIAIGQVTTVYQSGGQCNDIFCVLNTLISGVLTPINNIVNTLLGLLNTAANLFLTVLTGIIGLGLAFLIRLFALFNQATGLFTGIISAYSTATPATISGLPICSIDPTSSPFCRATWVLDNTILGGRWAVLLILVLGIASIHLIIWVIGEFKSAIVTTGSSS